MPDAVLPDRTLAEQARTRGWWLRAAKRNPVIPVLLAVQLVIAPVIWAIWQPPQWQKLIATFVLLAPIRVVLRDARHARARTLEKTDEDAERTGRRRPVGIPLTEGPPVTFQWGSPAGWAVIRRAIGLAAFTTLAFGCMTIMLTIPASDADTAGYPFFLAAAGLILVVFPVLLWISNYRATIHRIRQVLATPDERTLVEVVGINPATRQWVLQCPDGSRIRVKLLGGHRLLVAGDELPAQGSLRIPVKHWRRVTWPVLALSAPTGTLWAEHRGAATVNPAEPELPQPKATSR